METMGEEDGSREMTNCDCTAWSSPPGAHTSSGDFAGNAGGSYHGSSMCKCGKCGRKEVVTGTHYPRKGGSGTTHVQVRGAMSCFDRCYKGAACHKDGCTKYSLA